jgi:hypothetical protein
MIAIAPLKVLCSQSLRNRPSEKLLKARLRKVRLECSVGAISAGRAKQELALEYAQAKQVGLQLDPRLEKATLDALRGPLRTFKSPLGSYWNSCLAIFQPLWLGRSLHQFPSLSLARQLATIPSRRQVVSSW